ncbi:MAG: hypothetical protein KY475_06750 [Planctomycetes bacterium]|nr:hypothetical protein [Planctomycetota bacterium]
MPLAILRGTIPQLSRRLDHAAKLPRPARRSSCKALRTWAICFAWIALILAILIESAQLLRLGVLLSGQPIVGDARLFFSMGQGWLNGLVLYEDLFETKPPLVFLLAALSLELSGGNIIYNLAGLLLLGLLGPALGLFGYSTARSDSDRWLRAALSALLGVTAAGYTLRWSDDFQAEGFGLLLAVLPSLLAGRRLGWDIAAGVSLGAAAMFKEPFAVAGALALVVLCPRRRTLGVLLVAGMTCAGILLAARALVPYVTIYLPEMLTGRSVASSVYTHYGLQMRFEAPHPLWLRSLNAYRIFAGLGTPPLNAGLGLFFAASCCLWIERTRPRLMLYGFALLGVSLLSAHMFDLTEQLVTLVHLQGQNVPWGHPILLRLLGMMVIPPALLAGIAWRIRAPWLLHKRAFLLLTALFIASALASYGGGDHDHRYLVFTLPLLLAIALSCILAARTSGLLLLGGLLVTNALIPGRYTPDVMAARGSPEIAESRGAKLRAERLDSLLTACGYERYLAVGDTLSVQAHTRHSPYQLNYGIGRAIGSLGTTAPSHKPNAYLAGKLRVDLRKAPVIILSSENDLAPLRQVFKQDVQFTTAAPKCAQPYLPIGELTILFKQSASSG